MRYSSARIVRDFVGASLPIRAAAAPDQLQKTAKSRTITGRQRYIVRSELSVEDQLEDYEGGQLHSGSQGDPQAREGALISLQGEQLETVEQSHRNFREIQRAGA